jgi:SulP family sulfate permease
MQEWLPRSIVCLRDYSWHKFASDILAGITVGLVALPLAMAFAIASGVAPQSGLYCAIVAGFLISALGGSTTQIGGPTGAFVVVVYGIVARYGLDGLFMCTLMAGVLLVILGVTGLGSAVKFIPRPVVVGFTNGIAVIIASTQIKDFFGLKVDKVPGEFLARMEILARNVRTLSPAATSLAVFALLLILVFMRYVKRVPGYIVALFAGTALVVLLKLPVETIGTRFGGIPSGFPGIKIPQFRLDLLRPLIPPAITVAMLGAIESLMSAVVSDRMSGTKHNPNSNWWARAWLTSCRRSLAASLPPERLREPPRTSAPARRRPSRVWSTRRRSWRSCSSQLPSRGSFRFRCWRRSCWSSHTTWASGGKFRNC